MNYQQTAIIFYMLITLVSLVGRFFTYEKMGIEGYKSFFPLYNEAVIFRRYGEGKRFVTYAFAWVIMLNFFVMAVLFGFAAPAAESAERSDSLLAGCLVMVALSLIALVATVIIRIPVYSRLAADFDKEPLFGAGFVLAPAVFWPLAAFSREFVLPDDGQQQDEDPD